MESLTGFFILEGLLFDIIGAYLVVSSIFTFKPNTSSQVYGEHFLPLFLPIVKAWIQHPNFVNTKNFDMDIIIKNIAEELSESDYFKESLYHIDIYKNELETEEKDFTENRAYSGLSFLVGGFTLQGIGVIIQLI